MTTPTEAESQAKALLQQAADGCDVSITEVKISTIVGDSGGYPGQPVRSSVPRARLSVQASASLNGSTKAAIVRCLEGADLPGVGKVACVRPDTARDGWWAEAMLDLELPEVDRAKAKTTITPFGGPVKLDGRQRTWLRRHGFPVPGMEVLEPLKHATYGTGGRWGPVPWMD